MTMTKKIKRTNDGSSCWTMRKKRKRKNDGSSCWQTPPADIMEKILQCFTTLGDQIRMRSVCKSWNSLVMRRDIRAALPPLFPWLLLPPDPEKKSYEYLNFASISERETRLDLKLPKGVLGGWIYGSSKGWLIIVKERDLNSKMFLFNPMSQALHHLPSLRTIPFFKKVVKTANWERFGAKEFCCHVALATHEDVNFSESFTVAAVFSDRKTLGLCRPGDKVWTLTQAFDVEEKCSIVDILFSSDTLYALVRSENKDGVVDAVARTLNVGFGNHAIGLKLKLVYDKRENTNKRINERDKDLNIVYNGMYNSMLLESTNSEVLLIHQMLDFRIRIHQDHHEGIHDIEGNQDHVNGEDNEEDNGNGNEEDNEEDNGNGSEEDDEEDNGNEEDDAIDQDLPGFNPDLRTRSFILYKIDTKNDNFIQLQTLGDQTLFCGNDGSFSLSLPGVPANPNNDFIFFARNSVWDYEATPKTYPSQEIGFVKVGETIARKFTESVITVRYQGSWFTPRL